MMHDQVCESFRQHFKAEPTLVATAPGRINLLGEHVDYNEGCVLPFAIQRRILVAAAATKSDVVEAYSRDLQSVCRFSVDVDAPSPDGGWENYIRGMVCKLREAGITCGGAQLWIGGDLECGGGMSSSAALCISIGQAIAGLAGETVDPLSMTKMAHATEHEFVGMPCGIMDQYTVCHGQRDQALLLDCRSVTHEYVPLSPKGVALLAVPSGVQHELSDGTYEERVRASAEAVDLIQSVHWDVRSLRDVTIKMLEAALPRMAPETFKTARHVVTEMMRVELAIDALRAEDWPTLGELLSKTQVSLRDDYCVSCQEIDALIQVLNAERGVLGARMVGGGFGGVVLALVKDAQVEPVKQAVEQHYYDTHGITAEPFIVVPSGGATVSSVS